MGFVKTPQELQQLGNMKAEFFEAEMIFTFWLTKPEIIARLLPPPLKPADFPLATAFIANYPRTSFGLPYKEAALFLLAQYEQVQGSYCLSMPVTDDMAMAGGREQFGFPKKIAHIQVDIVDGEKTGYVERHGIRFFELTFSVNEQAVADAFKNLIQQSFAFNQESGSGSYLIKSFMAPDDKIFDYPPRLIRQNTIFRPKIIEWGEAQMKFLQSSSDPWYEVEVINPLGALRMVGDNTMLSGKVLAEITPMEYAPYAFHKWDW
jgi:acetoacetate decarboxylase